MNIHKVRRLQQWLADHAASAAVLWRPEELVMLLGYYPFWGTSFALVPAQGDALLLIPQNEPPTLLPTGVRTQRYSLGAQPPTAWDGLFAQMKQALADVPQPTRPIAWMMRANSALSGVAAENPNLPEDLPHRLATLGIGTPLDATEGIQALLARKSAADLHALKAVHEAAAAGVDAFYNHLASGITEVALQCKVESAIACYAGQRGFSRGWAQVQSGSNSALAGTYNQSTLKPLAQGDLVVLELAVCVDGYWADITRTGYVGQPPAQLCRMYETLVLAQGAAQRRAMPGVPACDVYAAAAEVLRRADLLAYFPHALGHGVGFRYHDCMPWLTAQQTKPLEAGMVFTLEPGIYHPSFGGLRVEDNYCLSLTGCQKISICRSGLRGESNG